MDEPRINSVPKRDNVYGHVIVPGGIQCALKVVRRLIGKDKARIRFSGYDGASTLLFSSDKCDFESTSLGDGKEHLLNGGVAGTIEEVAEFVKQLSESLSDAKIEHEFEVYDESGNFVVKIPV